MEFKHVPQDEDCHDRDTEFLMFLMNVEIQAALPGTLEVETILSVVDTMYLKNPHS